MDFERARREELADVMIYACYLADAAGAANIVKLQRMIVKRNANRNKARLVAGYCWDWPTKTKADPTYHDIKIGDWSISWNLGTTDTYVIDPDSVNEAGCIHTVQDLELDYVGVIIGQKVMNQLGVPVSVVINMLYRQIIRTRSIPFPITLGNAPTRREDMDEATFNAVIQRGLDDAEAGRTMPAADVFSSIRAEIADALNPIFPDTLNDDVASYMWSSGPSTTGMVVWL